MDLGHSQNVMNLKQIDMDLKKKTIKVEQKTPSTK